MKISKISAVNFKAEPQQPTQTDKKESKVKELLHRKEAPYVIGASAIGAIVLGILAVKKGKVSKVKTNNTHEIPSIKPATTTPANNTTVSLKPENQKEESIIKMGPWNDSEILEEGTNIAHVDVDDKYIPSEIIKQTKNYAQPRYWEMTAEEAEQQIAELPDTPEIKAQLKALPAYITKYMTPEDALIDIKSGSLTPLKRIKMFLKDFDNSIDAQIESINRQYPIINNINKGYHRTKADFVKAFNEIIANPKSNYEGSFKVVGNSIHEYRTDGSKVVYIFEKGKDGGLRTIREFPKHGGNTAVKIDFAPDKYWDYGNGIGIHRLLKIEFSDIRTKKVFERISIHPEERSFHNVGLYNRKTGRPILTLNRTAEPGNLYYLAKMYDENTGKLTARINTKNDFAIAKLSDNDSKVVRIK